MSVLIKDMDMPDDCGKCHFCHTEHFHQWCCLTDETISSFDVRHFMCPLAQPEQRSFSRDQENDPIEPQGDAVSREAVLDMLHQECSPIVENFMKEKINAMPSVTPKEQPGIIRCKDCKYRMPYDWMFSEVWQSQNMDDYPDNEIGCQYCDMRMTADDFCSRAERREE